MSELSVLKRVLKNIKPVLLAVVLTFVAGSYFTSDPFTGGRFPELPQGIVVNAVCRDNQNQEQAGCKDRVEQALVTTHLKPQLRRFGFTAEEIARYDFGVNHKQKKGAEEGGSGKEERGDASDEGAQENVDAADGGPGAPEVKVEEATKRTNGNVR